MFNILIVDDSFLKIDEYKKSFIEFKDVMILDVIKEIKKINNILEIKKVDLIAFNIESPSKNDVKKIKEISKENKIPLIFGDKVNKNSKQFNIMEMKTLMLKKYILMKKNTQKKDKPSIVVIGSSTGGPRALQQIIPKLPNDLNGIILIVQHMPANFTASLADRLNMTSAANVSEAKDGENLILGNIYIAPGDYHMKIKEHRMGYRVELNKDEKVKGLRPAVDVLMSSVSKDKKYKKMSIILTGMGNDGADGVKKMKRAGSYNIIQDEASCVIYGMPRAAYETKSIDEIVELDRISESILLRVGCKNGFRY